MSWLRHSSDDSSEEDLHVVAFSGGIDSSLVAAAVHRAFPKSSVAVLGVSPSLPASQRDMAHEVAKHIGIPLREIETDEGGKSMYIENEGQACYACKTSLYQGMGWDAVLEWVSGENETTQKRRIQIYNGTNADDVQDATRVGLRAAKEFSVLSPLLANGLTKDGVRAVAREMGLPNWNAAASPCLRSRLALGVQATPSSLKRVEAAENIVKTKLADKGLWHESSNLRVRHLKNGNAAVELDGELLQQLASSSDTSLLLSDMMVEIAELGYSGTVQVRPFRSGAVAA
jgi:uncharacterized protein (TIGR00268 family)